MNVDVIFLNHPTTILEVKNVSTKMYHQKQNKYLALSIYIGQTLIKVNLNFLVFNYRLVFPSFSASAGQFKTNSPNYSVN